MSLREEVLELLHLPPSRFTTSPDARTPDRIDKGKVFVLTYRQTVTQSPQIGTRINELQLWILTPKLNLEKGGADDDLDRALDEVLDAIDAAPQLTWTTAERTVWDDAWHGYMISTSVPTT